MFSLCYTIFLLSFFLQARVYLVSISASIPFTCTIEPPSIPCILSKSFLLYYLSCLSPFFLITLLTTSHIFHSITQSSHPGLQFHVAITPLFPHTYIGLSQFLFFSTFFLLQAPALSWLDQATISVPFSLSLSRALPMPTLLSLYFSISLPYFLTSVYQSSSIPIINLNPCPLLLIHLLWLYVCAPTGNFTLLSIRVLYTRWLTLPPRIKEQRSISSYRVYVPDRLLSISIETQSQGHDYEAMLFMISM